MANPIKTSDLYQDTGEIKRLIAELELLQVTLKKLRNDEVKNANNLGVVIEKLNVTRASERQEIDKGAKAADEIAKGIQKYNKALSENNVKIQALREATRKANLLSKLTAKLKAAEKGSYDALSAQYSINKLRLNQMSEATRKATKEGKELEKNTNDIFQEMKALQEATGKHVLSVGDYEKGTSKLLSRLEQMPGALGNSANGVRGLGVQFKALLANPIVLLIATLVGGITALFAAFQKTERGANFMAKATGALQGIMSGLIGIVDRLVTGLIAVFEDPQQALKDFGNFLISQVVNRFKAITVLAGAVGKSLKALWERDLPALKEAAKEAGQALIQMGTGFDIEQQNEFAIAIKETTSNINDLAVAFSNLAEKRREVRKANRSLSRSLESLMTQEALLQTIVDDTTKSFKDRETATSDLQSVIEQRATRQAQIARNNLSLINQEISLRRGNGEVIEDLLDQQLAAYQQVKQAERDLTVSVRNNERERSELKQDRLERDLDILIDGFDNQKTINEKLIASDELTFVQRKDLLEKTRQLSNDSFKKQIETIQQFTGIAINSNELIGESDAVALNEKIRSLGLSEIIEGRLLEIIRDRKSANQDLAESQIDLQNAISKSDAKIISDLEKSFAKSLELKQSQFDDQQEFNDAEFALLESSEAEKTRFKLQAEKERWLKIIELNKKFGGELNSTEIETIKLLIKGIENEIENIETPTNGDIYDLLGIELGDEGKQSIKDSFEFAIGQLNDFLAKRVEATGKTVELRKSEVQEARDALDDEREDRNAGFAHNVQTREKELRDAKARQAEALAEQRKAQKVQEKIQTIQQTGNLISASAKILATLGIFAAPALAIMWGSFIASKAQAAKLTRGKGGHTIIGGGSHASGNDTSLGFTDNGREVYAEKGEMNATFSKKMTNKYKGVLPSLVDSINNGTFEYFSTNTLSEKDAVNHNYSNDTTSTDNILREIRDRKQATSYVDGKGRTIVKEGNTTRIYV